MKMITAQVVKVVKVLFTAYNSLIQDYKHQNNRIFYVLNDVLC